MISLELALYLINIINNLNNGLSLLITCFLIYENSLNFLKYFEYVSEYNKPQNKPEYSLKLTKISFALFCVLLFIPSEKTCYSIFAVSSGKEIAQSEVGNKVYEALDKYLNKTISDLEGTKHD